jgi:hypothetical protein
VTIKRLKLDVNGLVKITSTPTPSTRMAAPTVAKISTMMRDRRAATAMSWRFSCLGASMRSVETESREESRERLVALMWGRAAISLVVEVMAAVMRLICAPTCAVAAVLSRMFEDGERGASVASGKLFVSKCYRDWTMRTD